MDEFFERFFLGLICMVIGMFFHFCLHQDEYKFIEKLCIEGNKEACEAKFGVGK